MDVLAAETLPPPPPFFGKSLESSQSRGIPSKTRLSKNLNTKLRETKGLGARRIGLGQLSRPRSSSLSEAVDGKVGYHTGDVGKMNSQSPPKPSLDGASPRSCFGRPPAGFNRFGYAHAVHYSTFEQCDDSAFQPLACFTAVMLQIMVRARCWPSITAS